MTDKVKSILKWIAVGVIFLAIVIPWIIIVILRSKSGDATVVPDITTGDIDNPNAPDINVLQSALEQAKVIADKIGSKK